MSKLKIKVLIVDDEKNILTILSDFLQEEGFLVSVASSIEEAEKELDDFVPDIVLLDIWMKGSKDGLKILQKIKPKMPNVEVIMMSGHGTVETAVQATKMGAWDFLEKPLFLDRLSILIKQVISLQKEKKQKSILLNRLRENIALIGVGGFMKETRKKIPHWIEAGSKILFSGKKGLGKEIFAKNIHYLSDRFDKEFVSISCGKISEDLFVQEFFGFEEGYYPNQKEMRLGKVELANKGTLFLKDIEMLSLKNQEVLLKFMKQKSFKRLGGDEEYDIDVSFLASSVSDIGHLVSKGEILKELYEMFQEWKIPSLIDRKEDIMSVFDYFLNYYANKEGVLKKRYNQEVTDGLLRHTWDGNIRELKNFVEKLYILSSHQDITMHDMKGLQS